jgi:phenylpropionate dioxygenase-like ring-hydroxylating dioxygenase large terminal subunit
VDTPGTGWTPGDATGRHSVFSLPRHWYIACFSAQLGTRSPLGRTVHGVPLALFRDRAGHAVAVLDRCPHRNVPLSIGRNRGGELECAYHGWRFDGTGRCVAVPGLDESGDGRARRVESFPVRERDGAVWVVPSHDEPVTTEPPALPHVGDRAYTTVRRHAVLDGTVVAAVENALDVPHTAYLHRGLFRGGRTPVRVEAVVRHGDGSVEAEYLGEPVPPGLVARVLAPEGGVVEHVDRFLMPSLSQVEYRLGPSHLVVTTGFTPIAPQRTALHATVTFRSRLPGPLVARVASPIAGRILTQDARILSRQHDNIERFGGERFANTPIDVLGPHILRLLRTAERGEPAPAPPPEERVVLYT